MTPENDYSPKFIVIDLFCGFGGTTLGYTLAAVRGKAAAIVAACVNHDHKAIKSHWMNHPEVEHFNEDITRLYGQVINGFLLMSSEFLRLKRLIDLYRAFYPNAKIILWASLECTNFSKAKGGMSRDADSRTLAHHLDRYIRVLEPDYVKIEEVVEFMTWGPLIIKVKKNKEGHEYCPVQRVKVKKTIEVDPVELLLWELEYGGKKKPKKKKPKKKTVIERYIVPVWIPEPSKKGQYWFAWRKHICSLGYRDEWKQLNSADFGAYTSRNRLFGIFARPELPIVWPQPTHVKELKQTKKSKGKKAPTLFDEQPEEQALRKWKPVRDVLNFAKEGESIIHRKKPLASNSLERIYAGLVRFVANGDTSFLTKYFSGTHADKNVSVDGPAGALTTVDHHAVVQTDFLVHRHNGDPQAKIISLEGPARTLTSTGGNQDLVQPVFLTHYYSNGGGTSSIDAPCPAVTGMDGKALVKSEHFIERQFGKSQNQSIHVPAGTVLPNDKHRLISTEPFLVPTNYDNQPRSLDEPSPSILASRRHHYLVGPAWGGNPGSVDQPCCVIVARGDKVPLYLVQVEQGPVAVAVYQDDSPIMVKIKQFMAAYGLVDIKMRMLEVTELLRIQGFPDTYKMKGNQSDQKKFIGNSVVPVVVKAWAEVLGYALPEPMSVAA